MSVTDQGHSEFQVCVPTVDTNTDSETNVKQLNATQQILNTCPGQALASHFVCLLIDSLQPLYDIGVL